MNAESVLVPKFLSSSDFDSIGTAISKGYSACHSFMKSNVVTDNFLVGMDQRSRLINVFVEHSLTFLDGFTYEFKLNTARNCWHTRFYKSQLALTAHFLGRGKNARAMPKAAVNRATLATRNLDLFAGELENPDIFGDLGYCWILHAGFVKPKFAALAIPNRAQDAIVAQCELPIIEIESGGVEEIDEEIAIGLLTADESYEAKTQ